MAEKITYFNNYYIYRFGIGTRVKPINEFNGIKINIAEYTDVINDRFNIFIDPNIDNLLILVDGRENWFFVSLIWEIHVFILATIFIENRITRILPRGNVKSNFNTLPPFSRKHDDDRPGISHYNNDTCS